MQVFGELAHNMVQNSSYTIKGVAREYVAEGDICMWALH